MEVGRTAARLQEPGGGGGPEETAGGLAPPPPPLGDLERDDAAAPQHVRRCVQGEVCVRAQTERTERSRMSVSLVLLLSMAVGMVTVSPVVGVATPTATPLATPVATVSPMVGVVTPVATVSPMVGVPTPVATPVATPVETPVATHVATQLLSAMYGSLSSPNFPEPYPRHSALRWNISVAPGYRLRLYFSHFHLEPSYLCQYDYVQVEADGEVLALFCGLDQTDTEDVPSLKIISSPRNSLSVFFCSDFSDEERYTGFLAHYSAEDVDECSERSDEELVCDHFCHNFIGGYYCSCRYGYLLHSDNRTCTVECSDGVFRERSGVLSSVDFPSPYPKSSDCSYRIEVAPGFRLRLQFDPRFDVEDHPEVLCPYDHVKVLAGSSEFGPFCGDRAPPEIQTDSNVVTVFFHSDNSGENAGWSLQYTSIGSKCPALETPPNAMLNPVQSEYSFKDHVLFTCSPGYRLLKDGETLDHYQLDCQSDGSWSSSPPLCYKTDSGRKRRALSTILTNHSPD